MLKIYICILKSSNITPRTFVCISNLSEHKFCVNNITNKCLLENVINDIIISNNNKECLFMRELTKRQSEIYDYIKKIVQTKGYPPSVREIGEAVGLKRIYKKRSY